MSAETITPAESVRLCELERVIQKGKDTFVEVGTALAEIRDSRIYRATFKTFEEYCQKRWDMGRDYAERLISSANVVSNLPTMGGKPTSERQARPLAKLPAEQQPAAWEKAQEIAKEEGKPVAARHVEAAVLEVMPKGEPETVVVDGIKFPDPNPQKLSAESIKSGDDAAMDSEKLWLLKSTWKTTSKKDRSAFAEWIIKN